jgi:hypothetical protein
MNKFYTFLAAILLTTSTFAQAPEKMSYQAVIRNSSDALVTNQAVGMRISILQTTTTGTAVYVETQTPTTNINGLVSLEIGAGTPVTGTFAGIDWAAGPYFIKTETDPTGGITYTITGTSQLMSVPYALHAKTAESVTSACGLSIGDTYQGGIIFYLDASGCHGLISDSSDLGIGAQWWNGSYTETKSKGLGLFEGKYNSQTLVWTQGGTTSAGAICYNYAGGGFTDWYLPTIEELNLMCLNIGQGNSLGLGNIGSFSDARYWSSSESYNNSAAWTRYFSSNESITIILKDQTHLVRPIRSF